jgi:DNA topoisomerase-3
MSFPLTIEELIVAEKPGVGQDLAKAIGGHIERGDGYLLVGRYAITWAIGHLLEQQKPDEYDRRYEKWHIDDLVFFPVEWKVRPRAKKDKKTGKEVKNADGSVALDPGIVKQINTIGKLLKVCKSVVNAGDAGREGQLIVDELLHHFTYRGPAKRLWLQETSAPAIRKALASMRDNAEYHTLYLAALARSQADFLVGINLTRGYTHAWQAKGNKGVLHFGRVQTPTLCMIVARDLEIEHFTPVDYFALRVQVQHQAGSFEALWLPRNELAFLGADGKPVGARNKQDAESIAVKVKGKAGCLHECKTEEKRISPPLPFSLGGLQKEANKQHGLSPTETLKIAQSLYEVHKLISYPRTDFEHYPEGDFQYAPQIIAAVRSNYGTAWTFPGTPDFSIKSAAWNDAKIGDHFALRPTQVGSYDLTKLSDPERKVYHLVVRQFLAQFYPHYVYESTVVTLHCEGETFRADGQIEKQVGWRTLFLSGREAKKMLPPGMQTHDPCDISQTHLEAKKTTPPERFNGATLIDAMEKAYTRVTDEKVKKFIKETGIGTPATRAAIIENLVGRGYVEDTVEGKRKVYISTAKGRMLYRAAPEWFRAPDLTAYFEELLKQVEQGTLPFDTFLQRQRLFLDKQIAAVRNGDVQQSMPTPQELRQAEDAPRIARGTARKVTKAGTADAYLSARQPGGEVAEILLKLPLADGRFVHDVDGKKWRVTRKIHGALPAEGANNALEFIVKNVKLPDYGVIGHPGFEPAQIGEKKANERADCCVVWLTIPSREGASGASSLVIVDHYFERITESVTRRRLSSKARQQKKGEAVTADKRCTKCGHVMYQRKGPKGTFWGCGGYPDCRHTENIPA